MAKGALSKIAIPQETFCYKMAKSLNKRESQSQHRLKGCLNYRNK